MSIYVNFETLLGAGIGALVSSYIPGWRIAAPVIRTIACTWIGNIVGTRGCIHKWIFSNREVHLVQRNDQLLFRVYVTAFKVLKIPTRIKFAVIDRQDSSRMTTPINEVVEKITKYNPVWSRDHEMIGPNASVFGYWYRKSVTFSPAKVLYQWDRADASVSSGNNFSVQLIDYEGDIYFSPILRIFNQSATWLLPLDSGSNLEMIAKLSEDINYKRSAQKRWDEIKSKIQAVCSDSRWGFHSCLTLSDTRDRAYMHALFSEDTAQANKIIEANEYLEKSENHRRIHALSYLKDCRIRVYINSLTMRITKVALQLFSFKSSINKKIEINRLEPAVSVIRPNRLSNKPQIVVEEVAGKTLSVTRYSLQSKGEVDVSHEASVWAFEFDRSTSCTFNITRERLLEFKRHVRTQSYETDHGEWIRSVLTLMDRSLIVDHILSTTGEDVRKSCCIA